MLSPPLFLEYRTDSLKIFFLLHRHSGHQQYNRKPWSLMKQSGVCLLIYTALCACGMFGQTEKKISAGNGPGDTPQATFFVHRLGTDHAEGITTLDMNGDGRPDILSGAYWYENPGAGGGEWKRPPEQKRRDFEHEWTS